MTITGACYMPAGTIRVRGDLTVTPGAWLDAVTPGDGLAVAPPADFPIQLAPAGTPLVPATLSVGGNVKVDAGAVLLLGCSPNISCPQAVTHDWIGGNLTADQALGVFVHSTSVGGNFTVSGGGGGQSVVDGAGSGACDNAASAPAPWSEDQNLDFIPIYSDVEDNSVGGDLSITGVQPCWFGALRNRVGGSLTIADNNGRLGCRRGRQQPRRPRPDVLWQRSAGPVWRWRCIPEHRWWSRPGRVRVQRRAPQSGGRSWGGTRHS